MSSLTLCDVRQCRWFYLLRLLRYKPVLLHKYNRNFTETMSRLLRIIHRSFCQVLNSLGLFVRLKVSVQQGKWEKDSCPMRVVGQVVILGLCTLMYAAKMCVTLKHN